MRGSTACHLFDHRKDDPVRFSVMARPQLSAPGRPSPTPKPSRDHVSASSTSSYAASISSSTFTLSSTTDGSSTSSSLFDGRPNQDRAENSIFALQLKKLYREITNLETKIKQEDSMDDTDDVMSSRVVLKGKEVENEDLEKEKWKKQLSDHKMLVFLVTS
jgi:protein SMG6